MQFFIHLFYAFRDYLYGLLLSSWHLAGGNIPNGSSATSSIINTTENNTDPQSNTYRF